MRLSFELHASRLRIRRLALPLLLALLCFQSTRAQTPTPRPVLLSEETTTRAIAFDSVTRAPAPFPPDSIIPWNVDARTRIAIFAMNLSLQPNEDLSAVTAEAVDATGRLYVLKVEAVAPVPGFVWMKMVVLRLSDELADVGDVLVSISYRGTASNRVRVGVGHEGGGPPDDAGARPTPPRLIGGRVVREGEALSGVKILVTGAQVQTLTTAPDGSYSFIAAPLSDYTITPQPPRFFDFDPPARQFVALDENPSDADFNAVRQKRTVSGQIHDEQGVALQNYGVTLEGVEGFAPVSAMTGDDGKFSFRGVPAGMNYKVKPANEQFETFAPQEIEQLSDDLTLDIHSTRRRYAIAGRVFDYAGFVAGVKVEIPALDLKTTTDGNGAFRFNAMLAGKSYTVNVANPDYVFDTPVFKIDNLSGDFDTSLHATPQFTLSGRVVDASGKGVFGINVVAATGQQTASANTRADGSYTMVVNFYGDYTFTPAREQGFRTFDPPARVLHVSKSARADDFKATLNTTFSPSRVLQFDGTPMTIDYGVFWEEAKPLSHFFWECWAMPAANTSGGYMISDGYGGAHAILFGFGFLDQSEPNHYQLSGNTWDGHVVSFASDEGPQVGEWGHYAVGWDGEYLITYFDGVPVGRNKFNGQRTSGLSINGAGHLLVGGSDHNNFSGRIAQISGHENVNPREGDGTDKLLPYAAFTPQTIFSNDSEFLTYSFRPGDPLSDLSHGYKDAPHRGIRRGTLNSYLLACDGCPVPEFVVDSTAPDFSKPDNPGGTRAPTPPPAAVPTTALVFDSFSRLNSTYILGGKGGLGSTEGGSLGARAWASNVAQNAPQPFGILNGRAVVLANTTAVAWVETGATDVEVRAERRPRPFGTGQNTGVSFRVADAANYFFAYTTEGINRTDAKTLTVGFYSDGVRTDLATGIAMPDKPETPWITLRVQTGADGRIQIFADATPVFSTTSSVHINATGAGLYNNARGLALANRWDNFTVLPLQN